MTRQAPAFPHAQSLETDRADGDPSQRHDFMAKTREHPADFTVLPFGENHLHDRGLPASSHDPNALGSHLPFGEPDAVGQLLQDLAAGGARHDDAIDLFDPEFRVGELVGEFTVVGHEQEPGALLVEPADAVGALRDLRQKVDHARLARGIVIGGDVALGFVNGEIDMPLHLDFLPIERNLGGTGVHLRAELANDLAVDCDSSLQDYLLAGAPGADPSMSEHFLKPVGIGRTRFLGSTCTNLLGPKRTAGLQRSPRWAARLRTRSGASWFCVTTAGRWFAGSGGSSVVGHGRSIPFHFKQEPAELVSHLRKGRPCERKDWERARRAMNVYYPLVAVIV